MDPLSVTASIIALVQAVGAVQKGIQFLRSLRGASDSIRHLSNELEAVLAVVEQVKGALDEVKALNAQGITAGTAGTPVSPVGQHRDVLGVVELQAKGLEQAANDLRALCARIVGDPATAANATGAKRRAIRQTTTWVREKSKIEPICVRIDSARKLLSLCLESINTTLLSRQTRASHQVQQSMHMAITGIVEIKSETQSTQMTMTRLEDGMAQHTAMLSEMMRMLQIQTMPAPSSPVVGVGSGSSATPGTELPEEALAGERAMSASGHAGAAVRYRHSKEKNWQPDHNESTYLIHTIIRKKTCLTSCQCRCHQHVSTEYWGRMSSILGSLFVEYNSLPILDPRPCNVASCVGQTRSVKAQYRFPQWMMARAFVLAASWGSLNGAGCDLHLQVPQVIQPCAGAKLRRALDHSDMDWLKFAISNKLISANTLIGKHGILAESIIYMHINDLSKLDTRIVLFLIEQGFSMTIGHSNAGDILREIFFYRRDTDMSPHKSLVHCIDAVAPPASSTTVQDIMLGISSVSLSYALQQAPWEVNIQGCCGMTPMHIAITTGNVAALQAMMAVPECDINAESSEGDTLLHDAVSYEGPRRTKMIRLLLEAGADVNITSNKGTAIFRFLKYPGVTKLLLRYGASTTGVTDRGISNPLLYSVWIAGDIRSEAERRCCRILVKAGMDVDLADCEGRTSFMWAVWWTRSNVAKFLLRWGAKVAIVDHSGQNILHCARKKKDLDFIPRSRLQGLDPDAKDIHGQTPMDTFKKGRDGFKPKQHQVDQFRSLLDEIRAINRAAGIHFGTVKELEDKDEDGDDEFADADEFVDAPEFL